MELNDCHYVSFFIHQQVIMTDILFGKRFVHIK